MPHLLYSFRPTFIWLPFGKLTNRKLMDWWKICAKIYGKIWFLSISNRQFHEGTLILWKTCFELLLNETIIQALKIMHHRQSNTRQKCFITTSNFLWTIIHTPKIPMDLLNKIFLPWSLKNCFVKHQQFCV